MGPGGIPTTIILLEERSTEMTPNDTLLYPWISALLRPHQRSFLFCRWELAQRPTAGHFGALSPKWDVFIKPSLQGSGKRRQKMIRVRGDG